MQRCAQAYLSSTGSLTRSWVHVAYDLFLCNDTEAAELDKRLQLINGNVWCEIFNTLPPFPCLSSGLYGSARKVFHFISVLDNSGYLMLEIVQPLSSVSCKSFTLWPASGITCCLVEALKVFLAAVQYTSIPAVRGGSHLIYRWRWSSDSWHAHLHWTDISLIIMLSFCLRVFISPLCLIVTVALWSAPGRFLTFVL